MPEEGRKRRHRRGEGSTYRVKDGGWVAALGIGYDRKTGKRRYVRRRAPDEKGAERALARFQREWGRAGDVAFQRLEDYLVDWLDVMMPSLAPGTVASYQGHIDNHIAPLLGAITVGALRPADVHRLIRRTLDKGIAPSTTHRIVTTLRTALSQAVAEGELAVNPAKVKLPRVTRQPVEAMTPAMAERILEAVGGDRLEALYILLLGTGMRLGEALALDWRDVDLDGGTAFIRTGKTRSATRTVHLRPFVVRALTAHRGRMPRYGPEVPVFLGISGERQPRSSVSALFPRLMKRHGMRLNVHKLRHGTATLLLAQGVPMRVISEVLGHSDPGVTSRIYAHVSEDSKRLAMEGLDEIGGSG